MNTFDSVFLNELTKMDALVKLNEYNSALMPPGDGFRLCVSELHAAGISSSQRAWGGPRLCPLTIAYRSLAQQDATGSNGRAVSIHGNSTDGLLMAHTAPSNRSNASDKAALQISLPSHSG